MELQDLKRWHWIAISLVIGGLLAYARTWSAPDEQSGTGRGFSANEFVSQLNRPKTGNGFPWIRNVRVFPPQPAGTDGNKLVSFVTCELLINTGKGKGHYEARNFNAEIPFKVQGQVEPKGENYSVRDYLTELKKTNENVEFRYAWWWQKNSQFAIWMGGSLVLIGGIWPSMVSLMIGAGLGRPKKSKEEKEYDLDRFGKYKEASKPAIAVKAGMSAEESRRLEEMQDKMEADLAAAGMQMTSATGEVATATESSASGVKKLTGAAVEVAPGIKPEDTEPREYTGEFYPVVKAHHAEETKEPKH